MAEQTLAIFSRKAGGCMEKDKDKTQRERAFRRGDLGVGREFQNPVYTQKEPCKDPIS